MKRFVFAFMAIIFLFLNCLPSSLIFADSGYTDSQLADIGTLMLTNLIASGEATELDFSDYTDDEGLDFLINLGELAVTGDPTGLINQGLTWLGGELSDAYESLIESIREWEYSIAPDLYNWWYQGTQYEYKLQPASNVSRPLSNLLRSPGDVPSANPDPDYQVFINQLINANVNDINLNSAAPYRGSNYHMVFLFDRPCSWVCQNPTSASDWSGKIVAPILLTTINITTNSNGSCSWSASLTSAGTIQRVANSNNYVANQGPAGLLYSGYAPDLWFSNTNNITYPNIYSYSSLNLCFNYLVQHFKYVNVYVDGEPWGLINAPTYPIVIPDILTVLNDEPAIYTFSEPTYIDLDNLKTLITNAINSSDILTWQDIDDYFVDVNGVQALPTIQIVRNDYDNMYLEQYPYPATLIGFRDPLTFNEHMLDNVSGQYLTPMVNVADLTVDILPNELKWVLGIGAILSIFALIINRLLE